MGYGLEIVSGGQTGADRAALDVAIGLGIPHRGWCPRGRWAEDGAIPARYELRETPSADPAQRTEWNVRDSDATVVFSTRENAGSGTLLTVELAQSFGRPLLRIGTPAPESADELVAFIRQHTVGALNVAGPRASEDPAVRGLVRDVLGAALASLGLGGGGRRG